MITIRGYEKKNSNGKQVYLIKAYGGEPPTIHVLQTQDKEKYLQVLRECKTAKTIEEVSKYKRKQPRKKKPLDLIYEYGGKFVIIKDEKYWGTWDSLDEALTAKENFIKNNWKPELANSKRKWKWKPKDQRHKHIYSTKKGSYYIMKNKTYYGHYLKLEDAIRERDLLIKYDWNFEEMCESEGTLYC